MNLETLRNQHRDAILILATRHKAENVRVFGSVARNEARPDSDIDFLVHFKPGASLLDWSALENNLIDLLQTKVDVISDRAVRKELAPFIFSEAVVL